MYIIENKKNKYKLKNKKEITEINGLSFGSSNRSYKIAGQEVKMLRIYNKKLARPIAIKQVDKKYKKLINILTELLISDDDTGDSYREALNQIEKFRLIIKNKYRSYLTKKDLEKMAKKLTMFQKEAKDRYIELKTELSKSSKERSSCK